MIGSKPGAASAALSGWYWGLERKGKGIKKAGDHIWPPALRFVLITLITSFPQLLPMEVVR